MTRDLFYRYGRDVSSRRGRGLRPDIRSENLTDFPPENPGFLPERKVDLCSEHTTQKHS